MQIFDVIIFFELRTIQQKTVKPTYLCALGARKLAEGKGHEIVCTVPNSMRFNRICENLYFVFLIQMYGYFLFLVVVFFCVFFSPWHARICFVLRVGRMDQWIILCPHLVCVFYVEISLRTPVPLFRSGSVHSGSQSL